MLTDILSTFEGFGKTVTGGAAAASSPTIFTDPASLRAALGISGAKWIIPSDALCDGKQHDFGSSTTLKINSDTTFDLRGAKLNFHTGSSNNETIFQCGNDGPVSNIIILNLICNQNVSNWDRDSEGMDLINLKNTSRFCFSNLDLSQSPDGGLDIRENVSDGSVLWSKFSKIFQSCMWFGDRLTLAHCWASNIRRRFPKAVGGKVHSYNNLIEGWLDEAIEEAKDNGQLLSEANAWGRGNSTTIGKSSGGKVNSSKHFSINGTKLRFRTDNLDSSFVSAAHAVANIRTANAAMVTEIRARAGATLVRA